MHSRIEELSLSGNQHRSNMLRRRLRFKAGDSLTNSTWLEGGAAAGAAGGSGDSSSGSGGATAAGTAELAGAEIIDCRSGCRNGELLVTLKPMEALLTDVVGLYLSRPGCEHPFHHAIFASYLASAPQMVLQCADYGCCAIMGEVQRQRLDAPPSSAPLDPAAAEAAEAEMMRHAKEERGEALQRLATQPVLQRLVEEHGAALCVHFIGAHPQRQGQGLGGAMLSHICELADQRRLHAYLEASTHRSKELYARHGFVHVADKPLGDEEGAPVLKVMVRSPSSAALAAAPEAQATAEQAAAAAVGQANSVETD
ncbi:hypothetical protein COHA_007023 [Chlorella ohadii]|uniref:N-acetyltransferase domain-containing protein n=1 Tax=Chlorella ohadii TaxID=2649997 RepID=A0AAD5H3U2_9CHLO|nr:hypothetical protein COHA_007023 [Chlorella ohadii]